MIYGNVKECQSSDALRTMKALVNAANIIVIAKSTTHMAVEDGGGEYSCATRWVPFPGAGFLQPPLPACPWSGERCGSICGGSGIVVAIDCVTSQTKAASLLALGGTPEAMRYATSLRAPS